jgi:DNA mismatch endonuclease (patch repair protein)
MGAWTSTKNVSQRMKQVRRAHTGLELLMRKLLRGAGVKFRSQAPQIGTPDFRIVGTRVLIFCDSSFWHGRTFKAEQFYRNRVLWAKKMKENVQRDKKVTRSLRRQGWTIVRLWDTEIKNNPQGVLHKLERACERAKMTRSP